MLWDLRSFLNIIYYFILLLWFQVHGSGLVSVATGLDLQENKVFKRETQS